MPQYPADSKQVNDDSDHPSRYRFGPFLLDGTRRILLRDGERIPLSAKATDTLLALVTRYGETVSKSELLEAVWGRAIVEENSLNKCISELRKALGEKRGQHDYIVTMTGVGYRFVAPVSEVASGEAEAPRELTPAPAPNLRHSRIALVVAALFLLTATLYVVRSGAAPSRRVAIILPFQNLPGTGDTAWISTAVGEMLYHELVGAGTLRLVSPDDATRMDRDLPERHTWRDVRNYSGADLALTGTVTVLSAEAGRPLRIDLRAQDLRTGEIVAAKSVDGSEEQTFSMIRSLAEQVTEALGAASPASSRRHSVVPTSARAMQFYSDGLAALRSSDLPAAKDRLLEAVEADPSNALCYSALSTAWSGLGYDWNAADAARRAFDLSSSLNDLDRLAIEARYRLATRDWQRAAELYQAIWKLVPDSIENASALLEAYQSSGKIEEARHVIARLRALPPPAQDDPRIDLLEAKLAGKTWSDFRRTAALAKQASEKAQRRGMRGLYAHALLTESRAMWSAGDAGSAEVRHEALRLCEQLRDAGCVALALRGDGNASFVAGRMLEAQASFVQALNAARQAGNLEEQLNELNALGLVDCTLSDYDAADGYLREALRIQHELRMNPAMTYNNYTVVLTLGGRVAEARRQAEAALDAARAAHEVESEADALGAIATLDRVGGDPRNAVAVNRRALAVAQQSGKMMAQVEIEFDLALALAATGEMDAAREALRQADSVRGNDEAVGFELTSAEVAFDAADYPSAERLARIAADAAHKGGAGYNEARAQSLVARASLAQGRMEESRAAASRAMAIRQTPDVGMARLEARFADVATHGGDFDRLAEEARKAGYVQLSLEIRLSAAEAHGGDTSQAAKLRREVAADAARRGYVSLAARAGLKSSRAEPSHPKP